MGVGVLILANFADARGGQNFEKCADVILERSLILPALYSINTFVQVGFKFLYTQIYIYNTMLAYNTHGFKSVGF